MGNRADDEGTDVEMYRKPLTDTVHADTPTGAPERLLALLDSLGFERRTAETAGPVYVWHEAPDRLTDDGKKQLASRAIPTLLMAGYVVNIPDYLFDEAAYRSAVSEVRAQRAAAVPPAPAPASASAGSKRSCRAV